MTLLAPLPPVGDQRTPAFAVRLVRVTRVAREQMKHLVTDIPIGASGRLHEPDDSFRDKGARDGEARSRDVIDVAIEKPAHRTEVPREARASLHLSPERHVVRGRCERLASGWKRAVVNLRACDARAGRKTQRQDQGGKHSHALSFGPFVRHRYPLGAIRRGVA